MNDIKLCEICFERIDDLKNVAVVNLYVDDIELTKYYYHPRCFLNFCIRYEKKFRRELEKEDKNNKSVIKNLK